MIIEQLKIKNFGKFIDETTINLGGEIASIIGENGTGKSSILFAIKLLFDKKIRRSGISTEWIPNIDLEVRIEYIFDSKKFSKLGVALPIEEGSKIRIVIEFKFDSDTNVFLPIIYIGKVEKLMYTHAQKLPFDDFIEIVHINANLENNVDQWIEEYFKQTPIIQEIDKEIRDVNDRISKIEFIKSFNEEIKENLFKINKNFSVALEANVQLTKIGRALNIFHKIKNERVVSHGEGYEKIISILSNLGKSDKSKIKIIIIDELENNFFYIYQAKVMSYFEKLLSKNVSQIIISTHSPNIIKIGKNASITKLRHDSTSRSFLFNEETFFDYYQKELPTAIFYEKILIVEGHSEKMFFEYLFKNNSSLNSLIDTSEIFILNNQGVAFSNILIFLRKISKNVVVLTDNDIWSKKYQGLKRIWDLSNKIEDSTPELDINFNLDMTDEAKKMVINRGITNLIFTQENGGDTFENSLLDETLIKDEDLEKLQGSKLKTLSTIMERISSEINETKIKDSKYLFKWIGAFSE